MNHEVIMAKVLLTVPEKFLKSIDDLAEKENRTRSELIREALRVYARKTELQSNAVKNALVLEKILK